jgi:hypothetical protein
MSNLSQGMNARIGASGALQLDIVAEDFGCRLDQCSLDAPGILLGLPAPIARAVVFERDFIFVQH